MIAALYVQKGGCYFGLPDVDPWDESRDARRYNGPWPVVAHPPCARWCQLAGLVEARWGYKRGEDGGTFESALAAVRRWGGVLEHPAYSKAWDRFCLPVPCRFGGWQRGICGGWVCHVAQRKYGHVAAKETWLYAFRITPPSMLWGSMEGLALVSWCGNRTKATDRRSRIGKARAAATPIAFRDLLLSMARSAGKP